MFHCPRLEEIFLETLNSLLLRVRLDWGWIRVIVAPKKKKILNRSRNLSWPTVYKEKRVGIGHLVLSSINRLTGPYITHVDICETLFFVLRFFLNSSSFSSSSFFIGRRSLIDPSYFLVSSSSSYLSMNQSGLLLFVDLGGLWLLLLLAASSSAPLAPRASSTIIRIVSPSSQKEERKKTRKKIHTIKSLSPAPEHLILLGVGGLILPDKTNTNKTHGRTSQYLLFFFFGRRPHTALVFFFYPLASSIR